MELFHLILLASIILSSLIYLFRFNHKKSKLPPGPPAVPILGSLLWLRRSPADLEAILRELYELYGPIVTLYIGSQPAIFVADRGLAHKALIERGSDFASRPPPVPATRFVSSNQHNINAAGYGPVWRTLRRNLVSEILNASRIKLYAGGREWVLGVLIDRLRTQSKSSKDGCDVAYDSFQFAMFCLLALMCFGEKLDEKAIEEIEAAEINSLGFLFRSLNVFLILPAISKYLFYKRWKAGLELRRKQTELLRPLIRVRREHNRSRQLEEGKDIQERFVYSYLDSVLEMKLPEDGGRSPTEDETVTLCSEFLNAGTDTTSSALQWTMAEMVRRPEIQQKLFEEISSAVGGREGTIIREEELEKMPYLKAVIMEGLRRHPPGHFVAPHAVTGEMELEGYVIPKEAAINFAVAEMGWDEKVWEDPMEFRPERFLSGGVDLTGSKGIKMMPFGAGRRMCPGLGLAMLHLEYIVANLVKEFEWRAVVGEEVDISEKSEFATVMKHPLRARLVPRGNPN